MEAEFDKEVELVLVVEAVDGFVFDAEVVIVCVCEIESGKEMVSLFELVVESEFDFESV